MLLLVPLSSSSQVRSLLSIANSRRTVAATLMNERSSRSHSVFTLRITGTNERSGETCSGSLNLVDLAGSERLNSSGAGSDKDRLKETQNINRSLSALGDVIAALGEKVDLSSVRVNPGNVWSKKGALVHPLDYKDHLKPGEEIAIWIESYM